MTRPIPISDTAVHDAWEAYDASNICLHRIYQAASIGENSPRHRIERMQLAMETARLWMAFMELYAQWARAGERTQPTASGLVVPFPDGGRKGA